MLTERERKRMILADVLGYEERAGEVLGAVGSWPVGSEFERRASVRQASVVADVVTPLLQAGVSGSLAGILAGIITDWRGGIIVAVVVAALVWAWLLADHNRQLWETQRLNGRGVEREAAPPARRVRVEVVAPRSKGGRIQYLDLPLDEEKLGAVGEAVLSRGVAFSRDGLCGAGVLSQSEYRRLASALVASGLAVEVGGNRRQLTSAGKSLLRELFE